MLTSRKSRSPTKSASCASSSGASSSGRYSRPVGASTVAAAGMGSLCPVRRRTRRAVTEVALRAALRGAAGAAELAVTPVGLLVDELPRQRAALSESDHRPWPLPAEPWLMGQTWHDLLFAHWPLEPEALRPLVPNPLALDLRNGRAWLGITPFVVGGLRLRGTPPLPWLSRFPELNVRTYVDHGGRPGIYFFSLDAGRLAGVAAARRAYRLPYFHADMSARREGGRVRYESRRIDASGPPAAFDASYGPAGAHLPIEHGSLERWLAERYCLYVVDGRCGPPHRAAAGRATPDPRFRGRSSRGESEVRADRGSPTRCAEEVPRGGAAWWRHRVIWSR